MTELSDQYVIYCRKSTDESSGQQTQSIPDQIKSCMEYAKANNLQIALKPDDFPFETQVDIAKEDAEADIYIRRIYQDTRKYYIIKEQKSAKLPGVRPKRKLLMSLIKKGKIKGLLSYAPDRQARNMLEGGEIIDC
ncbi:MAG TPA: recombinase family protein, partial [Candidatus Absconditabacterales bacterium]|nr:recombinase family protein [Candidatus Absconditabacterales bacterium]